MGKKELSHRLHNGVLNLNYHEYVKCIFAHPEQVNIKTDLGETPLHLAAFWGKLDKFYALINMGADPLLNSKYGNNALHYACLGGKDDFIIVELVKLGLKPDSINAKGETAIHLASNPRMAHYLALWCLRNNIDPLKKLDHQGYSPLNRAHQRGLNEVVQYWQQSDLPLILYERKKDDNTKYHA